MLFRDLSTGNKAICPLLLLQVARPAKTIQIEAFVPCLLCRCLLAISGYGYVLSNLTATVGRTRSARPEEAVWARTYSGKMNSPKLTTSVTWRISP